MKLSDTKIRKAAAAEKAYKLSDGAGLHLFVTPSGGKLWRFRYEFSGKEKLLSLGPYPAVSLAEARELRDAAKARLRMGRDPAVEKKLRKLGAAADAEATFETMAREWHGRMTERWTPVHAQDVMITLERDVFPFIGQAPIGDLKPPQILALLRKIEGRGAPETAKRVRQRISSIYSYAIATGRTEMDPAAVVIKAMAPVKQGRQPAIIDLAEAREALEQAEATPANALTKLALRFLALTSVRPGEVRGARWGEFSGLDGPEPLWTIPADRMKMRRDHAVPLARQAVEVLRVTHTLTGRGPLPFPSTRHAHRPMSENAIGYLLNRAGYHQRHVPHGWRATFSTIMNERHRSDAPIIDLMLAHLPKDKIEAAYNRAEHMARRRELAQEWADLLTDGLCRPADFVLMKHR